MGFKIKNRYIVLISILVAVMMLTFGYNIFMKGMFNRRFTTDKITIYYDIPSENEKSFVITDKETIGEISQICSTGRFRKVMVLSLAGLCTTFVDFNNGTVVGIYDDIDYGNIESEINPIGTPMYLPKGLNAYITKLIEQSERNS